jgi:hypothetical protein
LICGVLQLPFFREREKKMPARARVGSTYLIADARERAVIPFIEAEFPHAFVVKQVTTADYLVCRALDGAAVVLAANRAQRRTRTFAASFKDGRHDNVNKMIALRAQDGAQKLFYIVEGPAFGRATARPRRARPAHPQLQDPRRWFLFSRRARCASRKKIRSPIYQRKGHF